MPKSLVQQALILPTYGFITDEPTSGSEGTKARTKRACELIREGRIPRDVVVPFPQKTVFNKATGQTESLGNNVGEYVAKLPEFSDADIRILPKTYGTWADQIESYRMVRANTLPYLPVHVHIVSDRTQLGRMWLTWIFTHPKGWTASFYVVPGFRAMRDILRHEPLSYAKLILWKIPKHLFDRIRGRT